MRTDSGSRPVESAEPSGECARASTANMPTHLSPSGDHMCAPHQSNTPRSRKDKARRGCALARIWATRAAGAWRCPHASRHSHTLSQHAVMRPPTHAPCCASACDAMGLARGGVSHVSLVCPQSQSATPALYGTGRVCGAGVGQRALLGRLSQGHPYRDGLPRSALSPGAIIETTRLAAAVQAGPAHASPRSPSECAATLGSKRAWGDATLCAPARMRPWHWRC